MTSVETTKCVKLDFRALLTDLKACRLRRDLQWGRRIHAKAVESRNESNLYVVTALVAMYAKCETLVDARRVFDSIQNPSTSSWNALLMGYAANGEARVALDLFSRMKASGCSPDTVTYIAALKACTSLAVDGSQSECLERGAQLHSEIGSQMDHFVQSTLIDMYSKCGRMAEARRVFEGFQKPDAVSWNALLMGYVDNGEALVALNLFSSMKSAAECVPTCVTYIAVLKACASLAETGDRDDKQECLARGRQIHLEIGSNMTFLVQNTLLDMYAKSGSMVEAQRVFDSFHKPDVVSWTALLMGYAENGDGHTALRWFIRMKARGCVPNSITYVAALKACTSLAVRGEKGAGLERGRQIHLEIGDRMGDQVQSTLIDMYANCGSMVDARRVFDSIDAPNVVAWNALLLGYAENGEGHVALDLFSRMKDAQCRPDYVTYIAALKACASLATENCRAKRDYLELGRRLHLETGSNPNLYLQNTLVDMYSKCGSMVEARRTFDHIQRPNVVSWNALLLGYADNMEGHVALDLFARMKATPGCSPTPVTYMAAVKACTSLAETGDPSRKVEALELGRELHLEIGCHLDDYVLSTLIDMYAKCGSMLDARRVFDSIQNPEVVSWNALIMGYAENGHGHTALDLYSRMRTAGCIPTPVTYIAVLKACNSIGDLALGRKLHSDIAVFTPHIATCLVDMYAKCGSMVEARSVFDSHSAVRDISTWTALLTGYGSFGDCDTVFKLFEAMQDEGFQPETVTFVCILVCCNHAGLVEKAREYFEAMSSRYGVVPTVVHYTCMVDVLGRANQLNEAIELLRRMPFNPHAMTWRILLGASSKWKNVEVGKIAFESLLGMDRKDPGAHVLMAHICGNRGMWEEQHPWKLSHKLEQDSREGDG